MYIKYKKEVEMQLAFSKVSVISAVLIFEDCFLGEFFWLGSGWLKLPIVGEGTGIPGKFFVSIGRFT